MNKKFLLGLVSLFGTNSLFANSPIYVDFDVSGRQSAEVSEPNYTSWVVANAASDSKTISGVTVKIAKGSAGTNLRTTYYKLGVQSPYYARLVCDGVYVDEGNSGGEITITLSGLSSGMHTFLAYLNNTNSPDAYTYSTINVSVNGTAQIKSIKPTVRALSTAAASSAFVTFSGTSATIKFSPSSSATFQNVLINGFALDVNDPNAMATSPSPSNLDDHANVSNGNVTLSWVAASSGAKSHNVYVGTDSSAVLNASTSSAEYKGNQTGTSYNLSGAYGLNDYFWRIDEVNSSGTVIKGDVWRFRVGELAFDGAEGYGRMARGGRKGKVVYVTNLNDKGTGSLRAAVEDTTLGPRTIVFKVSGIIQLESRLVLSSPYVTVAGQTAPGKGITIRSAPFGITGHDDIVRFMRVRLGYGTTYDGMGMTGGEHSILDHNSISWTIDEAFSSRGGKNLTFQYNLISEALNVADHQNYPSGTAHGYAATIGGDIGSFHHNLLAHCEGRNWSLGGGLDGNGYYAGRLDIFNNVVYNWGGRATDGGAMEVNFVGNYYKEGPATTMHYTLNAQLEGTGLGSQSYYYKNNILQNPDNGSFACDGTKDDCGRKYTLSNGQTLNWTIWQSKPFFDSYATIQGAKQAYKDVLSDVGANMPFFDLHDQRIIKEAKNGTYTYTGSKSGKKGLPDRESDVGGFEDYGTATWANDYDTDMDGLPDWWENMFSASDPNSDDSRTGYTELERFLDWMATPNYKIESGETQSIDLSQYTAGHDGGTYSITSKPNGVNATISGTKMSVSLSNSFGGIGYIKFTLKDKDGDSYIRRIGVRGDNSAKSSVTEFFEANIVSGGSSSSSQGTSSSSGISSSSSSSVITASTVIFTKHGAGSSNQTVAPGADLIAFNFTWVNATGAKITGLPTGITATVNTSASEVDFAGTANDAEGVYQYKLESTGAVKDTAIYRYIRITSDTTKALDTIFVEGIENFKEIPSNAKSRISFSLNGNTIQISGLAGTASIHLYSISGQQILQKKDVIANRGVASLDLSPYGQGIYLVVVRDNRGTSSIKLQRK